MKLSENFVTANIKKQLEQYKIELEQYKKENNTNMIIYSKGIIKGLETALNEIENTFQKNR